MRTAASYIRKPRERANSNRTSPPSALPSLTLLKNEAAGGLPSAGLIGRRKRQWQLQAEGPRLRAGCVLSVYLTLTFCVYSPFNRAVTHDTDP